MSQETPETKKQPRKGDIPAIIAFVLALIPYLLAALCYLLTLPNKGVPGGDATWWLLIFYFWTIGFPILLLSIVCGIWGFNSRNKIFARLGFILSFLVAVAACYLLFLQ